MTSALPVAARRRRLVRSLLVALLTGLAAVLALFLAMTCRPSWYAPRAIDYARLRQDKADLLVLQDQISAALNAGRSVEIELNAAQLNRWLAARAALWPELGSGWTGVDDPFVRLEEGRVRVAVRVHGGSGGAIASATFAVDVTERELRLTCASARLGLVPIPSGWIRSALTSVDTLSAIDGTGDQFAIENYFIWPNGKRPCKLAVVEIGESRLRLILEPVVHRPMP